jgi:hypothetical protein
MQIRATLQIAEAAPAAGVVRVSNNWWRWLSSEAEGAPA